MLVPVLDEVIGDAAEAGIRTSSSAWRTAAA